MSFGLKFSAQAFQRLMDGVLRGSPFVFVYLDDILVASASLDHQHLHHVRAVSRSLGFFSKKLSNAETKYSAFNKELLALFLAIRRFRGSTDEHG